MIKFIKVQIEFNNEWVLLNTDEIIEVGKDNDGYTKIAMKGGSYTVHQKIEQIEAQLLRDEFAMAALPSFINTKVTVEQATRQAYVYADAMLKERLR